MVVVKLVAFCYRILHIRKYTFKAFIVDVDVGSYVPRNTDVL